MSVNRMTLSERDACENLVMRFAHYSDERRFEEAAGLFHEDGCFYRPLQPSVCLSGRDAILRGLASKPVDTVSWHVCTNLVFDKVSPRKIKGVTYFSVFMQENSVADVERLEFSGVQYLGRYFDVFTNERQKGWKIKERIGGITFSIRGGGSFER